MAEIDKQSVHDREVQEDMFHDCVKSRVHAKRNEGVTIAAKYVPMPFAEDMSASLLSSTSTVDLQPN